MREHLSPEEETARIKHCCWVHVGAYVPLNSQIMIHHKFPDLHLLLISIRTELSTTLNT